MLKKGATDILSKRERQTESKKKHTHIYKGECCHCFSKTFFGNFLANEYSEQKRNHKQSLRKTHPISVFYKGECCCFFPKRFCGYFLANKKKSFQKRRRTRISQIPDQTPQSRLLRRTGLSNPFKNVEKHGFHRFPPGPRNPGC